MARVTARELETNLSNWTNHIVPLQDSARFTVIIVPIQSPHRISKTDDLWNQLFT